MNNKLRAFLEGWGTLFDFTGELYHSKTKEILGRDIDDIRYETEEDGLEIDYKAILGDWERIGDDIRYAMKKFDEEQND